MVVRIEIQEAHDGSATVWLYHQGGGVKRKTRLGTIHGPFFFKPVNVVYENLRTIGIEKTILEALYEYGVRWIVLKIGGGWYPTPIVEWLKNPDYNDIRYRGEIQHHMKVERIKVLADVWRDNYERLKKKVGVV